jgi:CRP/FNR family cyclic AMP-dependent transcriptional regulator
MQPEHVAPALQQQITINSDLKKIINDADFREGVAWHNRHFQAGERILEEGASGRSMFLIESGDVRVMVSLKIERRVRPGICDLHAGDIFGELNLFEQHPRSASVTAITDVQLLEINGEQLSQYLNQHPEIGYPILKNLFKLMVSRLNKANRRIEYLLGWGLKAHDIE